MDNLSCMPRTARQSPGGMIFHVLNRGNARDQIFDRDSDYAAFEKVLAESQEQVSVRILSYCLMPNHWHLVLWPFRDGDLGRFMQRLTTTHVRRWQLHHRSVGTGHLYQGTYKSFPVEEDIIYTRCCVRSNATRSAPRSSNALRNGGGAVSGVGRILRSTKTNRFCVRGQFPGPPIGSPA